MKKHDSMALYWKDKGKYRSRPKISTKRAIDFYHGPFVDMTDWWKKYGYFARPGYFQIEPVEETAPMTMVQEWDEWLYYMSLPEKPGQYSASVWWF